MLRARGLPASVSSILKTAMSPSNQNLLDFHKGEVHGSLCASQEMYDVIKCWYKLWVKGNKAVIASWSEVCTNRFFWKVYFNVIDKKNVSGSWNPAWNIICSVLEVSKDIFHIYIVNLIGRALCLQHKDHGFDLRKPQVYFK